jgi:NAD(P)-dependent dehydrogenase (short-subunit alcohol dehydrogenase family)
VGINLCLAGRVMLVTGGVRGVGAGISEVFAGQGATVVTCGRQVPEGCPYEFHRCDVRDEEAVSGLISDIVERHGRLDVLVNSAGGAPDAPAADPQFNSENVELNLLGPLLVSQKANAVMQKQDSGGAIVSISATSGRHGGVGYGAATAGVENMTQTLAVEWAPKVRVNAVAVGMVETDRSELLDDDAESPTRVASAVPLGRLAKPTEIGWAAAFLASDAASYISGATMAVHGGGECARSRANQ